MLNFVCLDSSVSDKRVWSLDSSRNFSCSSYFQQLIVVPNDSFFEPHWMIWKARVFVKVHLIAWIIAHGKVNTCDLLQKQMPNSYIFLIGVLCVMNVGKVLITCSFVVPSIAMYLWL